VVGLLRPVNAVAQWSVGEVRSGDLPSGQGRRTEVSEVVLLPVAWGGDAVDGIVGVVQAIASGDPVVGDQLAEEVDA
jgi:hypothetical protein